MRSTLQAETVQFTTKGQIVIPARIRRDFQIEDGTKATVTITPEGILLRPITNQSISRGFGVLKREAGEKSFAQRWADHKREEHELEDK
jgi:AbrB family looped-hinge helix DNA binding protein